MTMQTLEQCASGTLRAVTTLLFLVLTMLAVGFWVNIGAGLLTHYRKRLREKNEHPTQS